MTSNSVIRGADRRFSVLAFVVLLVIYLVLLQGLSALLTRGIDTEYAAPTTVDELVRSMTVPVAVSVVLVAGVVAWLRWRRPVLVDERPVRRWVIAIPVAMTVTSLLVINYGGLAEKGASFVLLLLLTTLLVGLGEELMFRGIGLTVFRTNGFTETRAAFWSTALFALAHLTNLFSEGPSAIAQVVATMIAGYFFYLIRRRAGGLYAAALVHALWDFALISGGVVEGEKYPLGVLSLLLMIVLAIVVLARRKKIEPAQASVEPAGL